MKFFSADTHQKSRIFNVEVMDSEYFSKSESGYLLHRFEVSILNRLATMIAGYYFKKYKDEIIQSIKIDDVTHSINDEIKNRIINNLFEKVKM